MIDLSKEKFPVNRKTLSSYAIGWNDSIDNIKSKYNIIAAPRTEQDILKDFEKLGYRIKYNYNYELILEKENKVQGGTYNITIDKEFKLYTKTTYFDCRNHFMHTTMQEHKLLNELFTLWGWL